jgi:hypothetical protein
VAHTCNPNYLEDRDQEDHGSRLTPEKKRIQISEISSTHIKRSGGVAQMIECCLASRKTEVHTLVIKKKKN